MIPMQEKYFPTNQLQSIENTQSFIPLAHGQRALWHLYQMAPKSTALQNGRLSSVPTENAL
jgi:hypothetical protein